MKKLELLSPAGDWERLRFALRFGADAVYLGAQEFGMRAAPKNFTVEQLGEAVRFAHGLGRKVYLTLNTLPTNDEADRLPEFLREIRGLGLDAVIVADLGVLAAVKETAPELELHISTQAGVVNYLTARSFYEMGAKRVVLALSLIHNSYLQGPSVKSSLRCAPEKSRRRRCRSGYGRRLRDSSPSVSPAPPVRSAGFCSR